MIRRLFDVADASVYLAGVCGLILVLRWLVDSLAAPKWWSVESWRDRLARWNRQWLANR